jgi:prepilin peptidase CpaA
MGELLTFGGEAAFVGLLLAAAVIDGRSFRLPNWLTASLALAFVPWAAAGAGDPSFYLWHASCGAALFLVCGWAFSRGLMGGGDAKLLAACALWTGWAELARFLLTTGMAGGVLALAVLTLRPPEAHGRLPYGIAIAAGGLDFWLRRSALL